MTVCSPASYTFLAGASVTLHTKHWKTPCRTSGPSIVRPDRELSSVQSTHSGILGQERMCGYRSNPLCDPRASIQVTYGKTRIRTAKWFPRVKKEAVGGFIVYIDRTDDTLVGGGSPFQTTGGRRFDQFAIRSGARAGKVIWIVEMRSCGYRPCSIRHGHVFRQHSRSTYSLGSMFPTC